MLSRQQELPPLGPFNLGSSKFLLARHVSELWAAALAGTEALGESTVAGEGASSHVFLQECSEESGTGHPSPKPPSTNTAESVHIPSCTSLTQKGSRERQERRARGIGTVSQTCSLLSPHLWSSLDPHPLCPGCRKNAQPFPSWDLDVGCGKDALILLDRK